VSQWVNAAKQGIWVESSSPVIQSQQNIMSSMRDWMNARDGALFLHWFKSLSSLVLFWHWNAQIRLYLKAPLL